MSKKDYLLERNKQYPNFLLPQNRLDGNKRKAEDPLYDPNTLHIPLEDMNKLSPGMKRYWDIKKNSMSQILLYRFGDWYIAYYDDLDACIKLFDMIVVPHPGSYQLGFPQRNLNDNIYLLITNGHKVAICEQTETREQMEKRQQSDKKTQKKSIKKKKLNQNQTAPEQQSSQEDQEQTENDTKVEQPLKKVDTPKQDQNWKACRREIVGIYTKGTFNPGIIEMNQKQQKKDKKQSSEKEISDQNFDNRYVLVPLECVALHSESSKETIKMIRSSQFQPMIQYMTQNNLPTAADTEVMITRYFTTDLQNWAEGLNDLVQTLRKKCDESAMISFGLTIKYLESLMLAEQVIPFGQFYQYEGESPHAYINGQNHMTLNGNALENLEIFVINSQSYDPNQNQMVRKSKGSLMDYIDKTCTPYGQRLLRKWLSMPLIDSDKISERQDCIEDLLNNFELVQRYRSKARKTSHDLERMLSKVYSYSVKAQIHIAYDDLSWNQRLKDFKKVLDLLDELLVRIMYLQLLKEIKIEVFEYDKDNFKSERLKRLCTFRTVQENPMDDIEQENRDDSQDKIDVQKEKSSPQNEIEKR
ncbi:domain iii family protein [Stylonychia lemnae]|uniref:Domain iii family protein n=1 Tax=Stylonychia lemnae TaxID=5949 RepID=A0A078B4W2_STYLE|nr:domain iii family protein [Stylonychia lemnae]|eukprot:CDW88573.1 domain iii family protein [Stylonychia lemnae]